MLRAIGSGLGLDWGFAPPTNTQGTQVYNASEVESGFDNAFTVEEAEENDTVRIDKKALQAQMEAEVPQEIVKQLKTIEANIASGKTIGNRIAGLIVLNFLSQKFEGKEEAVLKLVSTAQKKLSDENIKTVTELTNTPYSEEVAIKIRTIFGIPQIEGTHE